MLGLTGTYDPGAFVRVNSCCHLSRLPSPKLWCSTGSWIKHASYTLVTCATPVSYSPNLRTGFVTPLYYKCYVGHAGLGCEGNELFICFLVFRPEQASARRIFQIPTPTEGNRSLTGSDVPRRNVNLG